MKNTLLKILCLISFISNAQNGTLSLHKINTKRTLTIAENKRIRVKTTNGKVCKGKFSIIDNNTIAIRKDTIALSSISKIRRQSFVSGTISSVIKVYGGIISVVGLSYAVQGGLGSAVGIIIIMPIGAAFGGLGFLINGSNHKAPLWEYKINNIEDNLKKDLGKEETQLITTY